MSKLLVSLNKFILPILVSVVVIRLTLIILPSYRIDMNTWQAWSARLVQVTPINFYAPNYFADYFPGYLYILWFLGSSFNSLFSPIPIFSLEFEYYLKLLTTIFDVLTAIFIYKIVSGYNKKWSSIAVILYLANPALALNSSIMGQVDGILTFFLISSTYYLLELKKPIKWSLTSAVAFLVKPQGLTILPISFLYLSKNFPTRKIFLILAIPLLMIFFSIPFFLNDPILGLFHLLEKSANTYPYTSIFSYNFWSLAGFWIPDYTSFTEISYQVWGLILFTICLLTIIFPLVKKNGGTKTITYFFALALSSMAFFMFLTRMHERYLFPFFAFLLIVVLAEKSVKLLVVYLLLSLIHFTNLWHTYYYYNYVYPNPMFSPTMIFKILETNYYLLTLLNLLGFGYLVKVYYVKKIS